MFERLFNSKINEVADWIIRLIMLNIMMIFFSLPIITALPAFSAGYNMFSDYVNKKNPKLFKDYFKYFKEAFGKKVLLELVIIFVFVLLYFNTRYYNLSLELRQTTFLLIGHYLSLALMAIWFAITLFSIIILRVYTNLKLIKFIKLAFFLAGKYYWIILVLVVIILSPFLLLAYATALTSFIFIFFGLSVSMLLNVLLTKRIVLYLESLKVKNG